jgi:outer membrane protein TolC
MSLLRLVALAAVAVACGGCATVRPVTLRPSLPTPPAYVTEFHTELPGAEGAAAPQGTDDPPSADQARTEAVPAKAAPVAGDKLWWNAFADPALDAAIQEALRNNYFIRDIRNLIYENGLDPAMPKGALWPLQIGIPATVQRTAIAVPPAPGQPAVGTTFNEADVGIAASYQIDLWGQLDVQRRTFEDLVEQQRQSTETFAQTLAEQVAQLWFQILEQRALKDLLDRQVRYSQDLLEIVKARFDQHLATRLVVLQQEQQLLGTQAQVPLVVAQLALLNSKLTALLGRLPSPDTDLVPRGRRLPDLPPAPAVGAPADLLQNSPELRMAQSRVAEAEHLVSQNLASWLPTINVFGGAGMQSFDFAQNFPTASVGVRLTWPIFDGGQRMTRAEQLELTVQRRTWQYDLAFNTAVQRVQDSLVQEQKQADNLRTLRDQVALGRRVLQEARLLFEQGTSDYLPVLTALANLSNLERSSIQAQRLLLSYRVQLYHALGGTWSKAATQLPD